MRPLHEAPNREAGAQPGGHTEQTFRPVGRGVFDLCFDFRVQEGLCRLHIS